MTTLGSLIADKRQVMPDVHLRGYRIGALIGLGGVSAVFMADRRGLPFEGHWQVVLKIVWNLEIARREAADLLNLHTVDGVVTLLDYFEISSGEAKRLAGFRSRSLVGDGRSNIDEDVQTVEVKQPAGVLVLQCLAGKPLIGSTRLAQLEELDDPSSFLVKDVETGQWYRQTLFRNLTLRERLTLCEQLAGQLAACHERGVVHGDLNPHNVLYDDQRGCPRLIDFGGSTAFTRGTPGWQSPEHFSVALGERDELPLKSDVFLLGMFINRLLEPFEVKGVGALVRDCLSDLWERPSARVVQFRLRRMLSAQERAVVRITLPIFWLTSALLPFLLWFHLFRVPETKLPAAEASIFDRPLLSTRASESLHDEQEPVLDLPRQIERDFVAQINRPHPKTQSRSKRQPAPPRPIEVLGKELRLPFLTEPEFVAAKPKLASIKAETWFGPTIEFDPLWLDWRTLESDMGNCPELANPAKYRSRMTDAVFARHAMWFETSSLQPVGYADEPLVVGNKPFAKEVRKPKKTWFRWLRRPFRKSFEPPPMTANANHFPPSS